MEITKHLFSDFEKEFFSNIHHFAFYEALSTKCQQLEGKTIDALIAEGRYKAVVATLLNKEGLNYGQLPKGLLLFHSYDDGARTPMEEHLVKLLGMRKVTSKHTYISPYRTNT